MRKKATFAANAGMHWPDSADHVRDRERSLRLLLLARVSLVAAMNGLEGLSHSYSPGDLSPEGDRRMIAFRFKEEGQAIGIATRGAVDNPWLYPRARCRVSAPVVLVV
jgi:hypothetical protein